MKAVYVVKGRTSSSYPSMPERSPIFPYFRRDEFAVHKQTVDTFAIPFFTHVAPGLTAMTRCGELAAYIAQLKLKMNRLGRAKPVGIEAMRLRCTKFPTGVLYDEDILFKLTYPAQRDSSGITYSWINIRSLRYGGFQTRAKCVTAVCMGA